MVSPCHHVKHKRRYDKLHFWVSYLFNVGGVSCVAPYALNMDTADWTTSRSTSCVSRLVYNSDGKSGSFLRTSSLGQFVSMNISSSIIFTPYRKDVIRDDVMINLSSRAGMKINIQIYKVSNHNFSQLKHHNHDF